MSRSRPRGSWRSATSVATCGERQQRVDALVGRRARVGGAAVRVDADAARRPCAARRRRRSRPGRSSPASKHRHASKPAKRATWRNGDVRHSSSLTSSSAASPSSGRARRAPAARPSDSATPDFMSIVPDPRMSGPVRCGGTCAPWETTVSRCPTSRMRRVARAASRAAAGRARARPRSTAAATTCAASGASAVATATTSSAASASPDGDETATSASRSRSARAARPAACSSIQGSMRSVAFQLWPRDRRWATPPPTSSCRARRARSGSPTTAGERVVLLFYPGDNTPVCTKQFCSYRDRSDDMAGARRHGRRDLPPGRRLARGVHGQARADGPAAGRRRQGGRQALRRRGPGARHAARRVRHRRGGHRAPPARAHARRRLRGHGRPRRGARRASPGGRRAGVSAAPLELDTLVEGGQRPEQVGARARRLDRRRPAHARRRALQRPRARAPSATASSPRVRDASARGVAVRALVHRPDLEPTPLHATAAPRTRVDVLRRAGVHIELTEQVRDLMHHKFAVRDDAAVWTGLDELDARRLRRARRTSSSASTPRRSPTPTPPSSPSCGRPGRSTAPGSTTRRSPRSATRSCGPGSARAAAARCRTAWPTA